MGEGLGERRVLFYIIKIRCLEEKVGIVPPTEERIRKCVEWLGSQDQYGMWTVIGYREAIMKLWKFFERTDNNPEPEPSGAIKQLLRARRKRGNTNKHTLTPEDMISPDEIQKIVGHCMNARDKALFSTMYDSGIRHGELLLMRNKHLNFDNYGAILKVPLEGKTGYRQVRVVGMSVPYLREWQNAHPKRDDPDAHLFCGLETQNYGDKLEYSHNYKSLKTALKMAGITRRIYPHLFRHTRATILSSALHHLWYS